MQRITEMEDEHSDTESAPPSLIPPLPRDSRGSLEVFNPSSFSTARPENPPPFRAPSQPITWKSWVEPRAATQPDGPPPPPASSASKSCRDDGTITSWMALKDFPASPSPPPQLSKKSTKPPSSPPIQQTISSLGKEKSTTANGGAAERAAEWGLVLKTDTETGKPQGVSVRNSGGGPDDPNKPGTSRRNSNNSVRTSGEMSDDGGDGGGGGKERGFPRVSEDLKNVLSTFQQTFVVSDATKSDYPIMYASAGFFKMTGYTSKEVIGRNCRFLQGADTDPGDVAQLREALSKKTSYCGRLLNYKKDGTPFWNLLTIAPIKDETGKVLKFIGMLVEVSKHTEGSKDKSLRPNGLPESLIRYDAKSSLDLRNKHKQKK